MSEAENGESGPSGNDGFTLLEVLIAFTILSISLAMLLGIFSQGLARARDMRDSTEARALAQSLVAEYGDAHTIRFGDRTGRDGAFAWRVLATPTGSQETGAPRLASIAVGVSWHDGKRTLFLTTLRLMPNPSPQ